MNDLILHHYPTSPFSEKVRLVLGLKKMRWQSVFVPAIMPKPDVVALTGGYRRTPFMQIGADIYCDSALMCRVIDRLVPTPPLYPAESAGIAEIVAQWADSSLFWTAVPYTMQPAGIAHLFAGAPVEALRAFGADRAAMSPNLRRAPLADAAAALAAYFDRLEAMLGGGRPFLLGESPSIADFAAFHSLWFMRRAPPVAAAFSDFTRVALVRASRRLRPRRGEQALERGRAGDRGWGRDHAPTEVARGQGFAAGDAVTVTRPTMPTTRRRDGRRPRSRRGRDRAQRRARGNGPRAFPAHRFPHQGGQEGQRMKNFKGGTAVITGAASGFGLETSRLAAQRGMNVVMADVQQDALDRAAAEIEALGAKVLAFRLDVSSAAEVEALGAATAGALRRAADRLQQRRRRRRRADLGEHASPTGSGCSASTSWASPTASASSRR